MVGAHIMDCVVVSDLEPIWSGESTAFHTGTARAVAGTDVSRFGRVQPGYWPDGHTAV
jgi:hypothetical protein